MAKQFIVTKDDKTVHLVNESNIGYLKSHSEKNQFNWHFEEYDPTDEKHKAKIAAGIDDSFLNVDEAKSKLTDLEAENKAKEAAIVDANAKLAELQEKIKAFEENAKKAENTTSTDAAPKSPKADKK